jgi:glycogen debranching enzyme
VNEVIEVNKQFYILAESSLADDRAFVLKSGDTFALFDHYGDIRPYGLGEQGIFHEGTRFLSLADLRIDNKRPLFLSSNANRGGAILDIDLSNTDLLGRDEAPIPRGTIHIARSKFLWQGICYEELQITNFGLDVVHFQLSLNFDADFEDIFEVRGTRRARRGEKSPPVEIDGAIHISYKGLDTVTRTTKISFRPAPANLSKGTAEFSLFLAARATEKIYISVQCEIGQPSTDLPRYEVAKQAVSHEIDQMRAEAAEVETSKGSFNASLERSRMDVFMMLTRTPHGFYPYAGVPWFSAPFGRDGILTALQTLWVNPAIARGALSFLAATQAKSRDDAADSEPGKILHEMRGGEMAALGEIPFRRYYGSVDSTPLFVMLAGAYYASTADLDFIESIWPNIEAAMNWIDRYGDLDGDGFVEYAQRSEKGLRHQGWKDSWDAVSHADGRLANAPIALCEVQGYVYAARRSLANLCAALGDKDRAELLNQEAQSLKERFDRAFWCEQKSTYALALDEKKQCCEVRSSNPGHCLFTGIANPTRAARIVQTLLSDTSFSGWGIRTLDSSEVRYNPMSYHNGSVWPHDNALIALGFSLFGFKQEALQLCSAIFQLSQGVHLSRLPELVCGFPKVGEQNPTLYPVACSPQSWAAGSIYMLLQACLGLEIDAPARTIRFNKPMLPSLLTDLRIRNLRVGPALVDLSLHRYPDNIGVNIDRRSGPVEIIVLK